MSMLGREDKRRWRIPALVILGLALTGAVVYFRGNTSAASVLWNMSEGGTWLLPLVVVSSLVDSINPCAFSILLLTIAFLFSVGQLRPRILTIGGVYILGIFLAYIGIGLGILHALHLFSTPHFMGKLGALLMIVLGLINLLNEFFPAFPIKLRIPGVAHHRMALIMDRGSIPTALLLGMLVGLCEFPCTGGPYLMILGLLHDTSTYVNGLGYLLLYNLIFVLPLVIILLLASDKHVLDRVQTWQQQERKAMRIGLGIGMIALGLVIYLL